MSASHSKHLRRRFGLIFLGTAVVMLGAGQTVLKVWLKEHPVVFVCFWLGCFVFTMLAIGAAALDAARVRQETRAEQRALIQETLNAVEREKQSRRGPES